MRMFAALLALMVGVLGWWSLEQHQRIRALEDRTYRVMTTVMQRSWCLDAIRLELRDVAERAGVAPRYLIDDPGQLPADATMGFFGERVDPCWR